MKQNRKQSNWAVNKALQAQRKNAGIFALGFGLVLMCMVVVMVFSGAISIDSLMLGHSGVIGATIITLGAVIDGNPLNDAKSGKDITNKLYILQDAKVDDTVSFPARVNREIGNIPLKAGYYWSKLIVIQDTPEAKSSGKMGDIAATITNELTVTVGGAEDDILNFMEKGIGQGFYVVYGICSTGKNFIGGNRCKPLKLESFEWTSGKDKTAATVTFKNDCGEMFATYAGNMPTQPAAAVAADSATITLTSNPQYQLASGTTAAAPITGFTGVTDADVNRVVTVLGSGGAHPSTIAAAATAFLLVAGETWTANTGSQISFKIFKDGAGTYKYVEVAGSRS